jgi:uncharacterized protein with gpF-like domain
LNIETKYNFFYDTTAVKRNIWKRTQAKRDGYERKYVMLFRTVLNRQFKALSDRIDTTNYNNLDLPSRIIDEMPVRLLFTDMYKNVGRDFAKETYRQLSATVKSQKAEDDLEDYWIHEMDKYVKTDCGKKITSITAASIGHARTMISKVIKQSTDEGWGAEETARAIRNLLNTEGIEINLWRSLRIARTEVMTASNQGQMTGARSMNMPMEKFWIATYDSRTRDTHMVVEEQNPKSLEEDFQVGAYRMDAPGDSRGGPEEVINCRCTVAFQVKGI